MFKKSLLAIVAATALFGFNASANASIVNWVLFASVNYGGWGDEDSFFKPELQKFETNKSYPYAPSKFCNYDD